MHFDPDQPHSDLQILKYFSSYLRDISKLLINVKSHAYFIIGIDPPQKKHLLVHNNMYSIMDACNTCFQDLRRVQTLLRGHVKGKISASKEKQSLRSSRFSNYNYGKQDKIMFLNQPLPQTKIGELDRFRPKNITPRIENHYTQGDQKNSEIIEEYELNLKGIRERQIDKKIKQSKSQGQLLHKQHYFPPPPSQASDSRSAYTNQIGSIDIINKIRRQLGIPNE